MYGEHNIEEFLDTFGWNDSITAQATRRMFVEIIEKWEQYKQNHSDGGIED